MFDKLEFANVIRKIKNSYENQEDFAKKSNIGRTSLSLYMNCRLDKPPKPENLKKLAYASNKITTYEELMSICGYTEKSISFASSNNNDKEYYELIKKMNKLNNEGKEKVIEYIDILIKAGDYACTGSTNDENTELKNA